MITPVTMLLLSAGISAAGIGAADTLPSCAIASSTATARSAGETLPSDEELVRRGAVIGEIVVRRGAIFDLEDPKEDRRVFRVANRIHRNTRESVIRDQLLFAPGEPYSPRLLAESERLLRDQRYLYDAEVRPVRYARGRVDVEVITRDVWTLTLRVNFKRTGGENGYVFELHDSNFLGTGKDLSLEREVTVDRTRDFFRYRDPNVFGTHARGNLLISENSDGHDRALLFERPFYALDARWAAGLDLESSDRVDPLYFRGEITSELRHRLEHAEIRGGISRGLRQGTAWRWLGGFTYERDRFSSAIGPGAAPPPSELPEDRSLAYPWIGFETVDDRFLETRDLDRIGRTEDVALGRRASARLGWSSPVFGGDRERWIFGAAFESAARPRDGHLLLFEAHASGRWADSAEENLVLGGAGRYYWRNWGRSPPGGGHKQHVLYVHLEADAAGNLDAERQLLLGGDTGLRGYPLRYQDGDRRFLFTLEQRLFTRWNILRLLNVGAAIFLDVGRAWFDSAPGDGAPENPGSGVLKDVGFGLRLGSTRSGRGGMIHLDVAFPLDGDPSIDGVQWLVTSKETF